MTRNRKRGPQSTQEFLDRLAADAQYQARKQAFDASLQSEQDFLAAAEKPIVDELNDIGVSVHSVWDLVNTSRRYTKALPILLRHLQEDYPERVRESIARAMAVPESRFAWDALLTLFRREFGGKANGIKWALGVALAAAADDEVMPDLISLFQDKRHGENRVAFVEALARSGLANARLALEASRDDLDVAREISRVLDRSKRKPAD
jgi:hypothetical protein